MHLDEGPCSTLWRAPLYAYHCPSCISSSAYASIRQHTSAYVSIRCERRCMRVIVHPASPRQHTSAYVSIRQHTSAYVASAVVCVSLSILHLLRCQYLYSCASKASVSIRQHTSAYVSIRQMHCRCQYLYSCASKASVSIRQHTSAYVRRTAGVSICTLVLVKPVN
jgi:hypothetical protein